MALSSCVHQDLVGVCLCNYAPVFVREQNQPGEKMMVILTEENMHLRQKEGKPILSIVTAAKQGRGRGRSKAK